MLGDGAQKPLAEEVYPTNPTGGVSALPEGRNIHFIDFSPTSSHAVISLGPFERAIDFCGDGSFYIVDTPGHFPGHISVVVRVAANEFAFLAGDLCHHRQCYFPGTRVVNRTNHRDLPTAKETIQKLVSLNKEFNNVIVILAHEPERLEEGMPLFPNDIREWVGGQVAQRQGSRNI